MTDEEVNKVIAEYMGNFRCICNHPQGHDTFCLDCHKYQRVSGTKLYTESLDALVPVWEKLNVILTHVEMGYVEISSFKKHPHKAEIFIGIGNTIQQAAAHATAKAILKLKE